MSSVLAAVLGRRAAGAPALPAGRRQVAALPVETTADGRQVLLITTRGSGKLIVPRGWPMKGKADFQAAAIEAAEEAGVSGPVSLLPIGSYQYRSRRKAHGAPIHVDVYRIDVKQHLPAFREKGQRRLVWLPVAEAAARVAEPGLKTIIRTLQDR